MPATAMCTAHGLRFDPEQSTGCVLCRRGAAAPSPGGTQEGPDSNQVLPQFEAAPRSLSERLRDSPLLMVGCVVLGIGLSTAGYFWWRGPVVPAREIVLGGDRTAAVGRESRECRTECGRVSEVCFEGCAAADATCQRRCLDDVYACDEVCRPNLRADDPFFRYGRGDVPDWWALLDQFDRARPELLLGCGLGNEDKLRMRLTQHAKKPARVFVDFPDSNKASCAAQVLGANFNQPGRGDYHVVATLATRPIDYAFLLSDALNGVDSAPGPAARDIAERSAQAYTARKARQAALEAQNNPRPVAKPPQFVPTMANVDTLTERRRDNQLERERLQIERERQLLERERHYIRDDELARKHAQGHIGNEQERWRRDYRRDDRQADREMWSEVEQLRRQREAEEQRARSERDRKVRDMEWRNRMRSTH